MSAKQCAWFDSAMMMPVPEVKNKSQVERLRNAAKVPGMETKSEILCSFADRLGQGWSLSEKQVAFMDTLLAKADECSVKGPWQPSVEERIAIENGVNLCRHYSTLYLGRKPSLALALRQAVAWLTGSHQYIEQYGAKRVMEACKGKRMTMAKASIEHPIGDLVELRSGKFGLVLSVPFAATNSQPSLHMLVDGASVEIPLGFIVSSKKTNKKNG